jgi:phosphotransacetylase
LATPWWDAQATTFIATAPKSNRSGQAYWAAAGDVAEHESLPVPLHSADRRQSRTRSYESTISERIARRAATRAGAKEAGRTPRSSFAAPSVPRGTGDRVMKGREQNRKKLAETAKKDAAAE